MHERSHWRSILAQPSPKSVFPTKQMCEACRSLWDFAPSSGPNYARVLCIFHESPLDISTHRGGHRFWVLFGSKPMAKTWRFRRFRASHEGKKSSGSRTMVSGWWTGRPHAACASSPEVLPTSMQPVEALHRTAREASGGNDRVAVERDVLASDDVFACALCPDEMASCQRTGMLAAGQEWVELQSASGVTASRVDLDDRTRSEAGALRRPNAG